MTDMPAFYPHNIIREVELRKTKGVVIHTLVLWTKHLQSLFKEPLYSYLTSLKKEKTQLYIQLTVTGIGRDVYVSGINTEKVYLEPGVPSHSISLKYLEKAVELVESPERIRFRIDPIIRIEDSKNNVYSNLPMVKPLIAFASQTGILNFTFSFLERGMHTKVDKRFEKEGIRILSPTVEEREQMLLWLARLEQEFKVKIDACCVPGLPSSACIDGHKLQELHPEKWPLDLTQPRSRPLCGCTKSVDIGGWPPSVCYSGCLYCYAKPKL